jgi:tetratricopeptide (TPR) repeat protein
VFAVKTDKWQQWLVGFLFLPLMVQWGTAAIAQDQPSGGQDSVPVLQEKIRQNPQNEETYLKLGELLVSQNQIEAALKVYRDSLPYTAPDAQDPQEKEAYAYADLGDAFMKLRRFPEALQIRQKVVQFQPQNPEFHEYLADALAVLGREEEAIATYIKSSQLELTQGEGSNSTEDFSKDAVSHEALAYESLGNVLLRYGKSEEAIVAYRTAIKLEPSYREFYTAIGNALVAHRQIPEAEASFLKAESMNPEPSSVNKAAVVQMAVGKALLEQDRVPEAIVAFEKAQKLAPENREIQEQLQGVKAFLSTTGSK